MAQGNRFDLTRLEQIERRLQVLKDAEAIRNSKGRYGQLANTKPSGRPHLTTWNLIPQPDRPVRPPCRLLLKTDLFDSAAATADPNGRLGGANREFARNSSSGSSLV